MRLQVHCIGSHPLNCYTCSEMSEPTGEKKKMVKVLASFPEPLYSELKREAEVLGIALTEHLRNIARERKKVKVSPPN